MILSVLLNVLGSFIGSIVTNGFSGFIILKRSRRFRTAESFHTGVGLHNAEEIN